MSTSFLGLSYTPIQLARGAVTVLSALPILVGVRGILVSPQDNAVSFGFHPTSWTASTAHSNPYIPTTAVRVLQLGLALFTCNYLKYDRAVGTMLTIGIITGVVDGITVMRFASQPVKNKAGESRVNEEGMKAANQAAIGHIGIPAVTAALGAWMIVNGEN